MTKVFLVIWIFSGPLPGKMIEIEPMPSMQICQSLARQMGEWVESEDRGQGRWYKGQFREIWVCIEAE